MFHKFHSIKRLSSLKAHISFPQIAKLCLSFSYTISCSFQRNSKSFKSLNYISNSVSFSSLQNQHPNTNNEDLSLFIDLNAEQIRNSHQILEKEYKEPITLNSEEKDTLKLFIKKLILACQAEKHQDKISKYLLRDLTLLEETQNYSLIVNANYFLGISYYGLNNFEKAEHYFKEVCSELKKIQESEEAKLLMIRSQVALGIMDCRRNDAEQALKSFDPVLKKTFEAPEAYLGETVLDIYHEIERLYLSGYSGRSSKHLIARVQRPMMEILKSASGEYSEKVFILTSLLAKSFAYQKKDNFAKMNIGTQALPFAEKSLEIAREIFEKESLEIGQSYLQLGNVYFIQRDYGKSLEFCKKAEEIFEKKGEICLEDLAETYFIMAKNQRRKGEYQEAWDTYAKAIESKGKESIRVAQMHLEWSKLLQESDETMSESKTYLNKALDIYNSLQPSNKSQIAEIKLYLGIALQKEGNFTQASELFKESQSLLLPVEGFRDARSDLLLNIFLGQAYLKENFYYESAKYLSRAVNTFAHVDPNFVKRPGKVYFDLGKAYEGLTLLVEAKNIYKEAAKLNAAKLGYDHPETMAAFGRIADLSQYVRTVKEDDS